MGGRVIRSHLRDAEGWETGPRKKEQGKEEQESKAMVGGQRKRRGDSRAKRQQRGWREKEVVVLQEEVEGKGCPRRPHPGALGRSVQETHVV